MKPTYFIENVYSIYPNYVRPSVTPTYKVERPVEAFERRVNRLFYKGKKHLYHEEYALAFNSFKELSHLILSTVHPTLPPNPSTNYYFNAPLSLDLLDPMMKRTAEILRDTPVAKYEFPESVIDKNNALPTTVSNKISKITNAGIHVTSHHNTVRAEIDKGTQLAKKGKWSLALKNYTDALRTVPATDRALRASITHDMAILNEKLNKKTVAITLANQSADLFKTARDFNNQVVALKTLSGLFLRSNKVNDANTQIKKANDLIKKHNLHKVNFTTISSASHLSTIRATPVIASSAILSARSLPRTGGVIPNTPQVSETIETTTPAFITGKFLDNQSFKQKKTMTIKGISSTASFSLSGNLTTNIKKMYLDLSKTKDLGILNGYKYTPTQMVAYLPHMYFYLLPMAMADCEIGMGKLEAATDRIESVLIYPFLNLNVEVINIWKKLADCFIDLGDEAYKRAKDNVSAYAQAKKWYEKIVKSNNTIDANSPLYKNAKFARIKQRIKVILAGPSSFISNGVTTRNENPAILWRLREAETMLFQIKAKLNFFGFDKNYIPPFSFDYLQETARYFAQHAAQMEQKYIQFKSTAENEELRYDQVSQQVELAQESIILEERGVDEAQAGIEVSEANRDYAETRRKNAVDQKNEFDDVRWELLEYAEAEAWAGASSVDDDDQVKLSWNGHYYNSSKKKRNKVLKDLAYKRTRITHDLQVQKLNDEIAAAAAYKQVAEEQLNQAKARKAVAEKRVEIAELQHKHAEENQEFLDLKEFGSGMWYTLAKKTKRLVTRYLDQATEIAFLMQRAYNAETERGLRTIKYNYAPSYSGFLVGADQLTKDIDYFTFDYITNIKTKKAPIKKTISLGDLSPNAFEKLLATGACQFQTKLKDFDREFPGMYLCKIKNVELVFVGITSAGSIAGSLRNMGVSKFRRKNGNIVSRQYPADVMPLSQYDIRQDALAFRFDPKDLKLFENNGLATIWELQLRKDANDFNFREILDIHLVMYYDGFHNATLESNIIRNLPTNGSAARSFSMQLYFPDELYYLRNNGEGELKFDVNAFPYSQTDFKRSKSKLKVLGDANTVNGLTLSIESKEMNKTVSVKTDHKGQVKPNKLSALKNGSMVDTWTVKIKPEDNPQLVINNTLDLSGINDIIFVIDYNFNYRS